MIGIGRSLRKSRVALHDENLDGTDDCKADSQVQMIEGPKAGGRFRCSGRTNPWSHKAMVAQSDGAILAIPHLLAPHLTLDLGS